MTEAQRQAFSFGPAMRSLADRLYGGSLDKALRRHASPRRIAQHWDALASMCGRMRRDYAQAILAAS